MHPYPLEITNYEYTINLQLQIQFGKDIMLSEVCNETH